MREEERAAVRRRGQHQEGGASLVEFALIVPILAMFLFGIVQFGIAYDMKQSVNSAAREGARLAAIPADGNNFAAIETSVRNSFDSLVDGSIATSVRVVDRKGTLSTADDSELWNSSTGTGAPCKGREGQTVVVVATVPYRLTIPFFGAPLVTLKGQGEFRCERSA